LLTDSGIDNGLITGRQNSRVKSQSTGEGIEIKNTVKKGN